MFNRETGMINKDYNKFDLSHSVLMDLPLGKIIPIYNQHCIAGDIFNIGHSALARFVPTILPLQHRLFTTIYTFYTPYRLLWKQWEKYITLKKEDLTTPYYADWLERYYRGTGERWAKILSTATERYSLWDYFGLPVGFDLRPSSPTDRQSVHVTDFARRAYAFTYNEYIRNQFIQDAVFDVEQPERTEVIEPLYANWEDDYFTTATDQRQVGDLVSIEDEVELLKNPELSVTRDGSLKKDPFKSTADFAVDKFDTDRDDSFADEKYLMTNTVQVEAIINSVKASGIKVSIYELNKLIRTQRFRELLQRKGQRYIEVLKSMYGVSPNDGRLDRPEFIGRSKFDTISQEVIQQSQSNASDVDSSTTNRLGEMAGHNIITGNGYQGKYMCQEHGIIQSLLVIRPDNLYVNRIPRDWTRKNVYEEYNPLWGDLERQEIYNYEVNFGKKDTNGVFGYQGRFDELRHSQSYVVGAMREPYNVDIGGKKFGLNNAHFGRYFDSSEPVALTDDFLKCKPDSDRVFGTFKTENPIRLYVRNNIKAVRNLSRKNIPMML